MHIMNISSVPGYSQATAVVLIVGVSVQIPGRKWLRGHVCELMQDTDANFLH